MKHLPKLLAAIGNHAAKSAVCASSPKYLYQPKEPQTAREKFHQSLVKEGK